MYVKSKELFDKEGKYIVCLLYFIKFKKLLKIQYFRFYAYSRLNILYQKRRNLSGRIKYIMSYKNHQVSPIEIENVIMQHPDILEVAIVGTKLLMYKVPHKIDTGRPMAFFRKIDG